MISKLVFLNSSRIALLLTSVFFILGGLAHWISPSFFMRIMPEYLPWHLELVLISGLCELVGGILIWIKPFRFWVGAGLIALCIAVFPANVNMAINHTQFSNIPVWMLYLRLPLQGVIIFVIYRAIKPIRA